MLFARLGPIIYRRSDELIAYARNPRKHPERQIVALMASISEFGFNMPILVDGDRQTLAGLFDLGLDGGQLVAHVGRLSIAWGSKPNGSSKRWARIRSASVRTSYVVSSATTWPSLRTTARGQSSSA